MLVRNLIRLILGFEMPKLLFPKNLIKFLQVAKCPALKGLRRYEVSRKRQFMDSTLKLFFFTNVKSLLLKHLTPDIH